MTGYQEFDKMLDSMFPLSRKMSWRQCPESIAIHQSDINGNCIFCGRHIEAPVGPFVPTPDIESELNLAYKYYYDPDYGNNRNDYY